MSWVRDVRSLAPLLADRRRVLVLGLLMSLAQAVSILPIAAIVRDVFSHRVPAHDTAAIVIEGLAILGLYLLGTALGSVSQQISAQTAVHVGRRLRLDVSRRLHQLPIAWFDARQAAEIHARIVPEIDRVEAMTQALLQLAQSVLVGAPLLVLAAIISPLMTAALAVLVSTAMIGARLSARGLRARTRTWQEAWLRHSVQMDLVLRTMPLIRARAADQLEVQTSIDGIDALASAAGARAHAQAISSALHGSVSALAGVGVLIVGGIAVTRGDLSLGDLLAYYAIVGLLLRNTVGVSTATLQITAGSESLARIRAVTDDPTPAPYRKGTRRPTLGGLALLGVGFGYGGTPVLDRLDLDIAPGEHVALVGPNGAGKSTVAALIVGLYRPWAGRLEAGGIPYDELDLDALRRQIGHVPQIPLLRPGSIRENIGYGRALESDAPILSAVELAGLTTFLRNLPEGLDTAIGDRALRLSGGQAQRIALARAVVARPRLLILDEPTNHLDGDAVHEVLDFVQRRAGAGAVLTITHDLELASRADRIVTLTPLRSNPLAAQRRLFSSELVPDTGGT